MLLKESGEKWDDEEPCEMKSNMSAIDLILVYSRLAEPTNPQRGPHKIPRKARIGSHIRCKKSERNPAAPVESLDWRVRSTGKAKEPCKDKEATRTGKSSREQAPEKALVWSSILAGTVP